MKVAAVYEEMVDFREAVCEEFRQLRTAIAEIAPRKD